jgi:ectoine hydroxylase-related dioxygenase (phytanoyl-CoA dioxygenase family)
MSVVVREGYQVIPQLLSASEVESLRSAITDAIDRVARVMLTRFEASCPEAALEERIERVSRKDRAYASALLQVVMADAQHDPRLASLAKHDALSGAVRALLAPELPTGEVIRTRAAIPSFTTQISPWHQDVIKPQEETGCASVRLACWIPLSDVDANTGALDVMPGTWEAPCSHTMGDGGHFSIPEDALPSGEHRVVSMRRGDVLLLDRFVPHRSRPTRGLHGRWAIVMWVKAGGARAAC